MENNQKATLVAVVLAGTTALTPQQEAYAGVMVDQYVTPRGMSYSINNSGGPVYNAIVLKFDDPVNDAIKTITPFTLGELYRTGNAIAFTGIIPGAGLGSDFSLDLFFEGPYSSLDLSTIAPESYQNVLMTLSNPAGISETYDLVAPTSDLGILVGSVGAHEGCKDPNGCLIGEGGDTPIPSPGTPLLLAGALPFLGYRAMKGKSYKA